MKVSVIIPCYNYEKYIEKCIMSVLLQNVNFDVEILISDDNSNDSSFGIINRIFNFYKNFKNFKIRIFKQVENLGEINNTKFLLENSIGEYIAYLDADDYWINPNKLQTQVDFLEENKDYSMCFTGYITLENNVYIPCVDSSCWLCPIGDLNSESLTNGNNIGSSSSRVFRKYDNLIKDYFYKFPYSDWTLNFELSLLGRIKYLDFPSYVYRYHIDSLSKKEPELNSLLYYERINILKEILKNKIINK